MSTPDQNHMGFLHFYGAPADLRSTIKGMKGTPEDIVWLANFKHGEEKKHGGKGRMGMMSIASKAIKAFHDAADAKKAKPSKALDMEVVTGTTALTSNTVDEIRKINELHARANGLADEARSKAEEAGHLAVLTGVRLRKLKESLPHGAWGKMFKGRKNPNSADPNSAQTGICAEFEFSQDTATRYMAVAENLINTHQLDDKGGKKLANLAEAPALDEKARGWLNKLTDGRGISDLYSEFGITKVADKRGGSGGARTAATEETPEDIQEKERKLAHQDALNLTTLIDAFVNSKKPTLLDKDHHAALQGAIATAHGTLKKIKL